MPIAYGLKVSKRLGEKAIKTLTKLTLIDRDLKIRDVEDSLVIPLRREPSKEESEQLKEALHSFEFVRYNFLKRLRTVKSLVEALENDLPLELLQLLPKSMDIVGSIAIIDISPELETWKHLVGSAVLKVNRNVETVLAKAGLVQGKHRLRRFEVIAGTGETEVVHREYGCTYRLDPTEAYFTPRLSEERRRVSELVRDGETIVDMFASVGPFAIQIGKTNENVTVYAVDVNERAYYFLTRNVKANGVEKAVVPVLGDIRVLVERFEGVSDRVILDLPEKSSEFIDVACRLLKPEGGIMHYYCFQSEPSVLEKGEKRLRGNIAEANRILRDVVYKRRLRQIAPRRWHVVFDAAVR
jgi:tRNA (guanine37-N1)-methyltransferase